MDVQHGAGVAGSERPPALARLRRVVVGWSRHLERVPLGDSLLIATGAVLLATLASTTPARSWTYMGMWASYMVVFGLAYWQPARARALLRYALLVCVALIIADRVATGARPDTWINPNAAASLLLLLLPWVDKAVSFPMLLGLAALAVTGSRGAWWAWGVALTLLIMKPRWYIVLPAAVALAAALLFIRPASALVRLEVWREALGLFMQRPVLGWGPGSYPTVAAIEPGKVHPDNLLLWLLVEQGVMGVLCWIPLLSESTGYIRRPGTSARLALTAWGLHQLFDCTLGYLPVGIVVFLAVALLARHGKEHVENCGTAASGT